MKPEDRFDVVIVGAGVAGALLTKTLTRSGLSVLLLEAGPDDAANLAGYAKHVEQFNAATGKGPESAWAPAPEAPQPDTADLQANNGYFVQMGPQLYGSTYTRRQGGSTLHWLGVCLRMLPQDFRMKSEHGVARDWPIEYGDLERFYGKAEWELGVSADHQEQQYHDVSFHEGYEYPMYRVPLSYSDTFLKRHVDGMRVTVGGEEHQLTIRSYPAARNSTPRRGYLPVGAQNRLPGGDYGDGLMGGRCQGNTSCTPVCPVQAKYNAGKTLAQADPNQLLLEPQAVASRILLSADSKQVEGIAYKKYAAGAVTDCTARAKYYVLAAHAVENARLVLASNLKSISGLVGKTVMDHPALYAWGLAPERVGAFRGPLSTAGLEDLRGGTFRSQQAAFRFDIGNDGWRSTTGSPDADVTDAVLNRRLIGRALRDTLSDQVSRQVRFSLAVEQLPDPANAITVDPRYTDALGNPRPVIHYQIAEYTLRGMGAACAVAKDIFKKARIRDYTGVNEIWFPTVQHGSITYRYHGMGHFSGTHTMGDDPGTSVVDSFQRCWGLPNLFLVGSGSFVTMGTSNPTLTLAALALRTAEHLVAELRGNTELEVA
jgi:choline dehydrogenase-like flavoprotein